MPAANSGAAAGDARQIPAGYAAIVTLVGKRFVFASSAGEDLGAYEGEFVRQRCIRVTRTDTPLTVYFRPDVGLARLEVVVELGRLWLEGTGFEAADITSPYTCEIQYQGRTLTTVQVPYHWWFARWRWQSAPRPIVRSPSALRQKRLIAPFGRAGLHGARGLTSFVEWSGPMDTAGLVPSMPSTGERHDIGLVTEFQAQYLISETAAALTSLLAQGEACGTMPIHWRDERTGAFANVYQYPHIAAHWNGSPRIPLAPMPHPGGPGTPIDHRYFLYDTSHPPAASYLPFVLTDDPFFLEELEAQGSFAFLKYPTPRNADRLPALVNPSETRGFAWGMRSLFQLGVVAPEKPPRWLNGRDYWRRCIADNLAFAHLYMQSPARIHRIFRAFTQAAWISSWQNSYVALTLGAALWMGYEDWRDFYLWFCHGVTQLCNGRSGWNREWPTPYYFYPLPFPPGQAVALVKSTAFDDRTAASWAEAWQWFKKARQIDDSGWDGHTLMGNPAGSAYLLELRAALAMATHLGVPEATECYNYIAAELPPSLLRMHGTGDWRWSIEPA
jgi:hypothetical protein